MRGFLFKLVVLFFITSNSIAQYTITGAVNSSSYSCATFSGNSIIYIGDGTTSTNLSMNQTLNLYNSCSLGPIQFIVRANASIDFSPGNNRLILPEGSSIIIEPEGNLIGGSCNASERIYVGNDLIASCNGEAGADYNFENLVNNGGYNYVSTLVSPVCGSGTVAIAVAVTPTPSAATTYNLYTTASGGGAVSTITSNTSPYSASITTPSISSTTTYYVSATTGSTTTPRREVVATVNPVPVITTQPLSQLDCENALVEFKVIASGSGLTYTWQRKRPLDASFVTIVDDVNNIENSLTNEIRILNIGSTQHPNGTQFQVIVSNGNCSVTSSVATLTVNEITNVTGSPTVTQCFGTNYSYTVSTSYPANVVSYRWKKSVTSGDWDEISNGGAYSGATTATLTISGGTPAESAEYRVYITFQSSGADCNVTSTSRNRKITFLPLLTTPVATITQPTCVVNTGTISVAVQSATDEYSFDNGVTYQTSNVKSGLAVGIYNVIIKNAAGCISSSTTCEIISETSTWDGTTWLNGNPDSSRGVIFEEDFNSVADIEACSCQVINGANVIINGTHTLKVTNAVDVVSGTLTFENNASLVQLNNAAINTGNVNYKRYTAAVKRYDFTYWSSPVAGQTMKNLSPNTLYDKYYSYDDGWHISYHGVATMEKGKGYSIRASQNLSITSAEIDDDPVFVGVPHNGIVNLALTANKLYFLGNPYPSAIDADAFLDANVNVLEGTLYFWTHNSLPSSSFSGDYAYNYTTGDYATYNRTGGVGTRVSTAKTAVTAGVVPTGKIAAGQGFFAPASTSGGTLVFNNSMRISGGVSGANNSQFFKLSTTSKSATTTATTDKNRVWLNLTNKEGAFKQTLLGYLTAATNGYDAGFDGVTYNDNQFVDFYSINQGMNLAIQARALPFEIQDSVVLGYKSTLTGEFQISIDHADGVLANQSVFLEDKDLQVLHDLKKDPYLFTTEKGVFNNRFVLRYVAENAVEKTVTTTSILGNEVLVSVQHNEILLQSPQDKIAKINIYDVSGKLVYQNQKVLAKTFLIQNLNLAHQLLLVQVVLANGETVAIKIVY